MEGKRKENGWREGKMDMKAMFVIGLSKFGKVVLRKGSN
jgi:hypothetical protein